MNTSSNTLFSPHVLKTDELISELEEHMEQLLRHDADEESVAVQAAIYHLRTGGRRIRARLAIHASLALRLSSTDALIMGSVVEFLHNASLVHDDLQDDELLRHGVPTVGVVFGTNVAICTGDLFLSAAYLALASFSHKNLLATLIPVIHTATSAAIRGQCAGFPKPGGVPKEMNHYHQVAVAKSGALFSLPLQLAFLGAGKKQWLSQASRAAEEFALGYQIMDDLQDVASDGPMAMNVVTVLNASGHGVNAAALAYEMGVRHLRNAADLAENLPDGAGDFLKDLAISLSQSLKMS